VVPMKQSPSVPRGILTLVIEVHARYRGMPSSLRSMHGREISLGKIVSSVKEAGQRAHLWMNQQQAATPRALALDERDSSHRGNASLHVMDVHSGHVWASIPRVEVDGDRWTLVWWSVREQGISCVSTVSDGDWAIQEELSQVHGEEHYHREVWHLFPVAIHVQGRHDRAVKAEQDRVPVIERQAEREAHGQRPRGRRPKATLPEQQALSAPMGSVADSVRSLCQEWQTVWEVVVLRSGHVLRCTSRHGKIVAVVDLLDELTSCAIPAVQRHIHMRSKQIRLAVPHTLVCAKQRDARQEQASRVLGSEAVALLAWAWLRRVVLGPTSNELLQRIPSLWQADASPLLGAWDHAGRASRAVDNWHRIVRPHVAVHRTLSAGMLALLAVKPPHQIAPRGLPEGLSPFQRTRSTSSDLHWFAALGSSPNVA